MGKKIRLFKIMPVLDGLKEWGKVQKGLLEPLKNPEVEITEVDLPKSPIKEISSYVHVGIVAMLQVEEAITAEEKGFDGNHFKSMLTLAASLSGKETIWARWIQRCPMITSMTSKRDDPP